MKYSSQPNRVTSYSVTRFGVRGNGGGQGTTFWSTLTGRTPKFGLHLDENRIGTHVFHIDCRTDTREDWDLLGYVMGGFLEADSVPVLADGFKRPDLNKVKSFFTSLATTSSAELCLIVGISPEARELEDALKGEETAGRDYDYTRNDRRSETDAGLPDLRTH